MKNRTKIGLSLFLISVSAAALALFAGCAGEKSAEEFLQEKEATDQIVTYYANGGAFDGTGNVVVKEIHYVADSYVIGDFSAVQNISVKKADNTFDAWYYAQMDADGKPVTDEEGNVLVTDAPVDFSVKIKSGEHWYICATWIPDLKVEIRLATDDNGDMHGKNGETYTPGQEIGYRSFIRGTAVIDLKVDPVNSSDYSFTQFFYDKECTKRVLGNIDMPEGEKPENPVIYAQYIKGNWKMVREIGDVRNMIVNLASGNYYICDMSENKVIDCSEMSKVSLKQGTVNAKVNGNGYTIKNLSYTVINSALQVDHTYSVFGTFGANAEMRDITFENLSVSVTAAREISLYLVSAGAEEGAKLENVTFTNIGLTVSTNTVVTNIWVGGSLNTAKWMFGGVGDGTDAAFLDKYKGLKVESAKLSVNGQNYTYPNS